MVTYEEMILGTKKKLKALMDGKVDIVTFAGVTIANIDFEGYKYQLKNWPIRVYGDGLIITDAEVFITLKDLIIAAVPLTS